MLMVQTPASTILVRAIRDFRKNEWKSSVLVEHLCLTITVEAQNTKTVGKNRSQCVLRTRDSRNRYVKSVPRSNPATLHQFLWKISSQPHVRHLQLSNR